MIELTNEQVQAMGRRQATPARVVNPQTQELFVLLPLAEYGRLVDAKYDDSQWTDEERDLLRLESCDLLDSFGKNL